MSRRFFSPLLIACALAGIGGSVYADTYDAVNDFSLNPQPENGVWTYLVNGTPLTVTSTSANPPGSLLLWSNGGSIPNSATIIKNTGSTAPLGTVVIPNDHLNLDPENLPNVSVDFTAPAAGSYHITGNFIGDDNAGNNSGVVPSHTVSVLDNSTVIYSGLITQFGSGDNDNFNLTETLNAGDTIAFVVGTNGFHNLSTGLQATIVSPSSVAGTPEPGAFALLGAIGVAGIGFARKRRRR